MILISDLVTDSQELGQVVLPSTLILGCTHFSSLTGSSLDPMEVLPCHSNTCVGCLLSSCCVPLSVLTLGWPVLYQSVAVQPSSVLTGGNNHTWNLHSTLSQRRSGTFAGSILLIFHPSCRINRTQLLLSLSYTQGNGSSRRLNDWLHLTSTQQARSGVTGILDSIVRFFWLSRWTVFFW